MEDKDALRQNLMDAGCDDLLTEQFLSLIGQGRRERPSAFWPDTEKTCWSIATQRSER